MTTLSKALPLAPVCAAMVIAAAGPCTASAAVVSLTRTNYADQWVTNVIEVRMPVNRFFNVYRTNYVTQVHTNLVLQYATNYVTRVQTNRVWVDVPRITYVQVQAYRTNRAVVNLTNWNTVLVFQTNWVSQSLTNVVKVELPAIIPPAAPAHAPLGPLALNAARGSRKTPANQTEVLLSVSWTNGAASPMRVKQWRIESDDGSVLCFGQDPQFARALPFGKYRVQVQARREENGPLFAAGGTLAVSPRDVSLQQGGLSAQ